MGTSEKLTVAVIGAGLFGSRRAKIAATHPLTQLVAVADSNPQRARELAARFHCEGTTSSEELAQRQDIDVICVSTPTPFLASLTSIALHAGKHVLTEKPFGRNAAEASPAVDAARARKRCLKVGYNHRYHAALRKAHELFEQGAIGKILFIRCRYGHGGRAGYEREWRSQADCGGGQLLDQGVHALDLFQWFLPDLAHAAAFTATAFWPVGPLEDNAFAILSNPAGQVATLHASWTNWKNIFSFEIFGESGYLTVEGLGGSYGLERLIWGKRGSLGSVPGEQSWEFPEEDASLELEWDDLIDCIRTGRKPQTDGLAGLRVLQIVDAIYRSAAVQRTIPIERDEHSMSAIPLQEKLTE